jgi:hypothetical protein
LSKNCQKVVKKLSKKCQKVVKVVKKFDSLGHRALSLPAEEKFSKIGSKALFCNNAQKIGKCYFLSQQYAKRATQMLKNVTFS